MAMGKQGGQRGPYRKLCRADEFRVAALCREKRSLGLTNQEIAEQFGISTSLVKLCHRRVYGKLLSGGRVA